MADVLIRNGTVIDGTGKEPRPNTSVFICGDKIQGLGEEARSRPSAATTSASSTRRATP